MKFKLTTPDKAITGGKVFQIKFEMESVNVQFRDNVLGMILAALDGGTVQQADGEVEQKPAALGFHKGDDDENA